MRRGFQLMELVIALALAAGPVAMAIHMVHSNVKGARFNAERASARLALVDLMELLMGEPISKIKSLSESGSKSQLADLVKERIRDLPEAIRKQYEIQISSFANTMRCTLVDEVDGQKGLSLLILQANFSNQNTVSVKRLFRPKARPGDASLI